MEELIKSSFHGYLSLAIFVVFWSASVAFGMIKSIKKSENRKLRIALCAVVCCALIVPNVYIIAFEAYPISLAYYEYKNDRTEEKVGVIDSMEQEGKDRVRISIDGTVYTIVYASQKPYANGTKGIKQGDTVRVLVGERSGFIFDIHKADSK